MSFDVPEQLVRDQESANSASVNCESDVVWAIPCTHFVGAQHLEEPMKRQSFGLQMALNVRSHLSSIKPSLANLVSFS